MKKEQKTAGRKAGKSVRRTNTVVNALDAAKAKKSESTISRDALIKKVTEIKKLLTEADKHDVAARYKIAVEFKAVIAGDGNVYGAGAARKLGKALGWGKTAVYAYDAVAKSWSAEKFSELAGKRDKFGQPLTWSHLMVLAAEKDGSRRRSLIKQTIDNGWSVRELKRALTGTPTASAVADAPKLPHTLVNALANYESSMKAAQSNAATYGNEVAKQIKDVEHADPDLLARLKQARADLELHYMAEAKRLDELIRAVEAEKPVPK